MIKKTNDSLNMETRPKINTVNDLRGDLLNVYQSLRDGDIGLREAKERANVAGKILSSAKIQLEYNAYTKSDAKIPFLES